MVYKESENQEVNFLEDIQDADDYKQFEAVLRLTGRNEEESSTIVNSWKKRTIKRYEVFLNAVEAKSKLDLPTYKSWFECIVNPEHTKLKNMPQFHRYVAYLLANYDQERCASILGLTRMSLWRWRKSMGYLD
jgi:hypothetical protein